MPKISFLRSSSTHLASIFTLLTFAAIGIIAFEFQKIENMPQEMVHLGWCAILLLGVMAVGLFGISYYVTKRINSIASTAEEIIMTGDLSRRMPVENKWDDLSKLSQVLNMMLNDIEQLMQGVRQVSDSIAHDLRTPLARLRNRMEETKELIETDSLHDKEDRLAILDELVHEADSLLNTFNALLRIANIESGKRHAGFRSFMLDPIVGDAVEMYEPLASDKQIKLLLHQHPPIRMVGDKDLIFQALTNMLDNAVKYTPKGGTIDVIARVKDGRAQLEVCDTGIGIDHADVDNIFRRFWRADTSRTSAGTGLGLSLVAAVAKLHRGNVEVKDNDPGLIITLTL